MIGLYGKKFFPNTPNYTRLKKKNFITHIRIYITKTILRKMLYKMCGHFIKVMHLIDTSQLTWLTSFNLHGLYISSIYLFFSVSGTTITSPLEGARGFDPGHRVLLYRSWYIPDFPGHKETFWYSAVVPSDSLPRNLRQYPMMQMYNKVIKTWIDSNMPSHWNN